MNLSLDPKTNWNLYDIAHLLRKVASNYTKATIDEFANLSPTQAVDQLLNFDPIAADPLIYVDDDPAGASGESWVSAPYDDVQQSARISSFVHWVIEHLGRAEVSARGKMLLFWHNHYPLNSIDDPNYLYKYWRTLDGHALGNIVDLCKAITIDPAMLLQLNGASNKVGAPNENYARELFELFTIGKGPLIAAGDYTNYTEHDIQAAARILTGWVALGFKGRNDGIAGAAFIPLRHDKAVKTLSEKFDFASFTDDGDQEFALLIDKIFEQRACAEFICRKLYRWFVHQHISESVETSIIQTLSDTLIASNYDVQPVLKQLLSSEHFFDLELRACTVKSPFEFIFPIISSLELERPNTLAQQVRQHLVLYDIHDALGMKFFEIPEVAGWRPYYQEPSYDKLWINNVSLSLRSYYLEVLLYFGLPFNNTGTATSKLDLIKLIEGFNEPEDPNKLIQQFALFFIPIELNSDQLDLLKQALIPGLPDFEWTTEYSLYLQDPTNDDLKQVLELRLKTMLGAMWSMPEFQLF